MMDFSSAFAHDIKPTASKNIPRISTTEEFFFQAFLATRQHPSSDNMQNRLDLERDVVWVYQGCQKYRS